MTVKPVPGSATTCTRCGQFIILVPSGLHYKYVTVTRLTQKIWKCQPNQDFPVRSHQPATLPVNDHVQTQVPVLRLLHPQP